MLAAAKLRHDEYCTIASTSSLTCPSRTSRDYCAKCPTYISFKTCFNSWSRLKLFRTPIDEVTVRCQTIRESCCIRRQTIKHVLRHTVSKLVSEFRCNKRW